MPLNTPNNCDNSQGIHIQELVFPGDLFDEKSCWSFLENTIDELSLEEDLGDFEFLSFKYGSCGTHALRRKQDFKNNIQIHKPLNKFLPCGVLLKYRDPIPSE